MRKDNILNITKKLADKNKDGRLWSIKDLLESGLEVIKDNQEKYNKAFLLFLNDTNNKYDVFFDSAGCTNPEILALFEVTKSLLIQEMGFGE